MKIFNTQGLQLVKKSLNVYTKQHEAIAKNIANANNDDYILPPAHLPVNIKD